MASTSESTEAAEKAKDAALSASEALQSRVERAADVAGDLAGKASETVRDYTTRADDTAEKVAQGMDKASDYLHETDAHSLGTNVAHYVKRHPLQAVAAAIVGGIVVGRLLAH